MQKGVFLLLLSLLAAPLRAQEWHAPDQEYPVEGTSGYSQGFVNIVGGQQLDYPPILQKGKLALMVVPGGKPIEFETEPMAEGGDDRVTFVWQASLPKTGGQQQARFDFYINGVKQFSFTRGKNEGEKNWMQQKGSTKLTFIGTETDIEKNTVFGYQFLSISRGAFPAGKPLVLKVTAPDAPITDNYTAYQNVVAPTFQVWSLQAVKRINTVLKQPVYGEFNHIGPPEQAVVYVDGKQQLETVLRLGMNKLNLWMDTLSIPREVTIELKAGKIWKQSVLLKPVRPFEVYFLPHSHVDIGFTHQQSEVEKLQWRNIDLGIELAKKTADYPDGSRYKWNVEVLWAVDGYLKNASSETRDAFFSAVKKGWIGLDALYGSELTGLQRPEELMRITGFANQLEREHGVQINSAMITDVPGYAWGIVPALAENEVKYFSIGPNHMPQKAHGGYQVGLTFEAWGDVPFYWESPSGKNKVLFWMTRHGYSWFHDWLLGKMRYTGGVPILKFLGELDRENYPYNMVQIRYTLGDNGGPDTDMPEFVRTWNDTYEYPKFRIATTREMFENFEQRYGDTIPTHRGDFTPYWEDGAASSALETATNRNTAEQLIQAETLWAMQDNKGYPKADFDAAWTNVLLFSEHTWGAFSSKSDPDQPFALNQWAVKKGFADQAESQTKALIDQSLSKITQPSTTVNSFLVFNTTSWERTEMVRIPAAWQSAGLSVLTNTGIVLPTQTLSTGEVAFIAKNIPPFSATRFTLGKDVVSDNTDIGASVHAATLSNEWLTVNLDTSTGAIASIRHKDQLFNLVDTSDLYGFNAYWYTGANAANPRSSVHPVIQIKENGPLVASLVVSSDAPGALRFNREIQLAAGINQLNITNFVDKKKVLEDENLRFSFPFNVPAGQVQVDLAWATMRPETDQLQGANKNFFCAQHFVDISNATDGVTWANLDAPLVETGEMRGQQWMSNTSTEPWLKTWQPSNRLFSWVMNNVWFVNYKGYQEGPVSFRYAIRPHKGFDSSEAKKFGIGLTQPLLLVPTVPGQQGFPSLLTLKGDNSIIITTLKPLREEKGLLLRLFNASDKPASTSLVWGSKKPRRIALSNQKEKTFAPAKRVLALGPWEIVTLKANY